MTINLPLIIFAVFPVSIAIVAVVAFKEAVAERHRATFAARPEASAEEP
ncbi:hypothetical protein [Antarcticirhabdus aurantiaca]|uniref:Uncharacterized protein n=1 Tax=Antarcticirhabdus aurantiaca TaxID=2606717 RepID=A0ACD4NNF1_9HYPH|nr:hypothetical protein [Antarcticirhabdus aurantiaca]WAJ28410.1 hypothetical protein OXU80_26970 [Jeongeuplla avenae]